MTFEEISELFTSDPSLSYHQRARIMEALEDCRPALEGIWRTEEVVRRGELPGGEGTAGADGDTLRYLASELGAADERRWQHCWRHSGDLARQLKFAEVPPMQEQRIADSKRVKGVAEALNRLAGETEAA